MYTCAETQKTLQHMTYIYIDDLISKNNCHLVLFYYNLPFLDHSTHLYTSTLLTNHIPHETRSPNRDFVIAVVAVAGAAVASTHRRGTVRTGPTGHSARVHVRVAQAGRELRTGSATESSHRI